MRRLSCILQRMLEDNGQWIMSVSLHTKQPNDTPSHVLAQVPVSIVHPPGSLHSAFLECIAWSTGAEVMRCELSVLSCCQSNLSKEAFECRSGVKKVRCVFSLIVEQEGNEWEVDRSTPHSLPSVTHPSTRTAAGKGVSDQAVLHWIGDARC